jgi:hypothetical protein
MAEDQVEESRGEDEEEQSGEGGSGESSNGHHIGRVAAVAAATGATAFAARKALLSRSSGDDEDGEEERPRKKEKSSSERGSLVTSAVASGWDVAKDSLIPLVEDAATKAGAYVAESAPEVVRDVVVPRFIAGFEKARGGKRKSSKSSESSDD